MCFAWLRFTFFVFFFVSNTHNNFNHCDQIKYQLIFCVKLFFLFFWSGRRRCYILAVVVDVIWLLLLLIAYNFRHMGFFLFIIEGMEKFFFRFAFFCSFCYTAINWRDSQQITHEYICGTDPTAETLVIVRCRYATVFSPFALIITLILFSSRLMVCSRVGNFLLVW